MSSPLSHQGWCPRSAWDGIFARATSREADCGIVAEPREELTIASVVALAGQAAAVSRIAADAYGVALPGTPRMSQSAQHTFAWNGPASWLAVAKQAQFVSELERSLTGLAAVTDQSHARAVLRVGGRNIREALAKGFPIDLHPRAFAPGQVAITTVSHIGVTIWQIDDGPTYDLFVYRSLAKSFWSWFSASAAEFGLEIR